MIEEFINDEDAFLKWVEMNPNGYVVNVDKVPGMPMYPMVHFASHALVSSPARTGYTTGKYFKVCSLDLLELEAWSIKQRNRPINWCETCKKLISKDDAWSDEELLASVEAYLEMQQMTLSGKTFVKAHYYKILSKKFGRTAKAFEYRMQNISYVMTLIGRGYLVGLKPAKNVGANIASKIETFIAQVEGKNYIPNAAFAIQVLEAKKNVKTIPKGNKSPSAIETKTTRFIRDVSVVAWVLEQAKGICECCNNPAPFQTLNGPYLEVHHVRQLAEMGPDTVANAIAICPNCHRRLHYGVGLADLIKDLYTRIGRLKNKN